jgi:subtilisin-like proprotein convertase family protein
VTSCGVNSADAFYRFTPPVSGSYTIDLCGSGFDTRLSVFTDCTSTQIGCNDDSCGLQSSLTLELSSGVEYYIRVSAFAAATTGDFILNISAPPIPTGACCIGSVCSILSEADCNGGGGNYLGDGSDCESFGATHTYSSSPFLGIPENQCASGFVSDSINVGDSFAIADLDVRVQVTHTFIGDLRIRLTNGVTTITLWERACTLNDNFDITFDDEGDAVFCATPTTGVYLPAGVGAGPLSAFDGQSAAGIWTIEVCDAANLDTGSLDSWELIFREPGPAVCDGGPQFCDADWCQDGSVGVPDIFCFLSDWFSMDPDARNYGGTPGVPAIFAFLSEWFATGQGPCTP